MTQPTQYLVSAETARRILEAIRKDPKIYPQNISTQAYQWVEMLQPVTGSGRSGGLMPAKVTEYDGTTLSTPYEQVWVLPVDGSLGVRVGTTDDGVPVFLVNAPMGATDGITGTFEIVTNVECVDGVLTVHHDNWTFDNGLLVDVEVVD